MTESTHSRIISSMIAHGAFISISITCIIPIALLIAISLTDINTLLNDGYSLIPKALSIQAYKFVFMDSTQIINSYIVTIFITVAGSVASLFIISMLAYSISRKDYKYQRQIIFIVFFTMLFNGGLVPWYIMITKYLHLKNTIWVLILPYMVFPWFVLLMKTFFSNIPAEIIEAAQIDGAKEFFIYLRIVLPMSKPALATIGLLMALRYWNDWWLGMLFIEKKQLIPLQFLLYRIMSNVQEISRNSSYADISYQVVPTESARMAMAIIVAGPMLVVFPFFQKYFVKGLTVGAVKG